MNDSVVVDTDWAEPAPLTIPRWLGWGLVAVLMIALGLWLTSLTRTFQRPLQTIIVRGALHRMGANQVSSAAQVPMGTAWNAIDLGGLRSRLQQLPWVSQVRVTRKWPDTLIIAVSERTPFARWGDSQLIDDNGELFTPPGSEFPSGLPQLAGAAGHEQEVLDTYRQLAVALANTPFALVGLSQDPRGDWAGSCQAGLQLHFGIGNPADKIPMVLGAVNRTLASKLQQVAYVDLRYTNGFAVGWKPPLDPSHPTFQGVSQ